MELWTLFIEGLHQTLHFFTADIGLPQAVAIMLLTFLLRLLLSPLSTIALLHSVRNRDALKTLKPELEQIKTAHQNDPTLMMQKTFALYKANQHRRSIGHRFGHISSVDQK